MVSPSAAGDFSTDSETGEKIPAALGITLAADLPPDRLSACPLTGSDIPDDQLAVAARVLDEQTVGVVATRDHAGQIDTINRRRHGALIVRGYAGRGIDWYAEPAQHGRVGMVAGHSEDGVAGEALDCP